jgi:glycosyltransferase involved in cell wall biosynthesis
MKVSILMPTYNDENLIAATINTVISQTYINWELLIMDDGSTDKTSSVVRSFKDARIQLFHQENKGQLVAINNLCPYITGDLVLLLHSDDRLYRNNSLALNIKHFTDTGIDGLYGSMIQFFDSGKPDKVVKAPLKMGSWAAKMLITQLGSNIILDHFFVRREKFESHVRINYLKWYMPYWLNFMTHGVTSLKLKLTEDPWYHYRVYDQNYTNSEIGNFEVYFTRFRSIFFLSDYLWVPFPLIQKEISRRLKMIGLVFNRKASKNHIAKCIKANIRSMRQRTNGAYTWYFDQLYNYYKTKSERQIILQSPIKIHYIPAEARKFYHDLKSNNLAPVYSEIIKQLSLGFESILVNNADEAEKMDEILKFLCIRAKINIHKP